MVAPAPAPEVVVREVPVEKIVEVVVTAAPLPAYTPLPIHTPMPTYTSAPVEVVYEEVIVEVVVTATPTPSATRIPATTYISLEERQPLGDICKGVYGSPRAYVCRFKLEGDTYLYHRGASYLQIGERNKARADFAKAKELGYDP